MDNNELFDQVISAMKDQTSILEGMMKASEERTNVKMEKMIKEAETRICIKIEHEVTGVLTHSLTATSLRTKSSTSGSGSWKH